MFDHESGRHFDIEGAKIYVEVKGDSSLEPLLFLHGGLGNIEDFNGIIPLLANKHRIIGIDSRGQGASTLGSRKLTYGRVQKDVEVILKELDVENVSLVGFSDGGIVAYRLACLSRLKVEKLVVIGARCHVDDERETAGILGSTTAKRWKSKFPKTVEKCHALNPEPDFERLVPSVVRMWLDEEATGYPNERVRDIKSPTLIVRGDRDHLFSRRAAVRVSELIAGSHLANIPFAGHVAFTDQKEVVMKFVNEFFEG